MVDYSLIAAREAQDVVNAAKSAARTMPILRSISPPSAPLRPARTASQALKSTVTLETWYCGPSSNVIVIT